MKLFSSRYTDNTLSFGLFILRLTAGGLLIHHGYDKLVHFSNYSKQFVDPFHLGNSATLGLVVFAEFFCAVLVVLGLLTRLASIPPFIAMVAAVWYGHNGEIFGEGEHAALFAGGFLALIFTGPGKYSLDRVIGK